MATAGSDVHEVDTLVAGDGRVGSVLVGAHSEVVSTNHGARSVECGRRAGIADNCQAGCCAGGACSKGKSREGGYCFSCVVHLCFCCVFSEAVDLPIGRSRMGL